MLALELASARVAVPHEHLERLEAVAHEAVVADEEQLGHAAHDLVHHLGASVGRRQAQLSAEAPLDERVVAAAPPAALQEAKEELVDAQQLVGADGQLLLHRGPRDEAGDVGKVGRAQPGRGDEPDDEYGRRYLLAPAGLPQWELHAAHALERGGDFGNLQRVLHDVAVWKLAKLCLHLGNLGGLLEF